MKKSKRSQHATGYHRHVHNEGFVDLRTASNPQRLHDTLDAAEPLLHLIHLAQLFRNAPVGTHR